MVISRVSKLEQDNARHDSIVASTSLSSIDEQRYQSSVEHLFSWYRKQTQEDWNYINYHHSQIKTMHDFPCALRIKLSAYDNFTINRLHQKRAGQGNLYQITKARLTIAL
jgi:hypothetical protein